MVYFSPLIILTLVLKSHVKILITYFYCANYSLFLDEKDESEIPIEAAEEALDQTAQAATDLGKFVISGLNILICCSAFIVASLHIPGKKI